MRYRIGASWPVMGGAMMIGTNTIVDDSTPQWSFLAGVVPPPDVQPLDEQTRDWLVKAYSILDHHWTISPVP
jgi:hypothetical protein